MTRLSSTGNSLIYSTYLGGGGTDYGYGISVDASGSAYVTGVTYSTNFPTENPFQTNQGVVDAFVSRLSSTGNSLIYSTYLGGGGTDYGYGISVDASGSAYVTGVTYSTNFPTENPFQTNYGCGDYDVFVTKLNDTGSQVIEPPGVSFTLTTGSSSTGIYACLTAMREDLLLWNGEVLASGSCQWRSVGHL